MRRLSGATSALILAIAVYFALFWGYDALRILTSPTYGLEDVWRSQVVFGLGRYIGLGPEGIIKLAAALGALKLVVAGVCAIHVFERLRGLFNKAAPASDVFETALILAVGVCIASLVPAIWSGNGDLMREQVVQLFLAGVTGAFCIIERGGQQKAEPQVAVAAGIADGTPVAGEPFVPWHR